ncbi:MAG: sigma-70 family RNA polymerase sigma factor [Caldilineaceae bacterium]|nr:sigma-70 family RNA polymerase sigma factor [Caldilineaceae bacterium]
MESFAQLVVAAQAGNVAAFGELVRRFQDMAVGYGYSILQDWYLAEDAAQEAFIEAHRVLQQLQEPHAFPAWLRRIVFKHCDRFTRGKRPVLVALTEAANLADAIQPATEMEGAEMRQQIINAIRSLSAEEQAVITLFYMGEYAHREIAAFLELPTATVNNRLRSARKRLQERMMKMVTENLQAERPSRNDEFAQRVLTFINAADSGYADEVAATLAEHPELVDEKGRARYSTRDVRALHYALNYGHTDVIEKLLAAGAEINAKADESWAPIHYALRGAHPELAPMLVAKGAEVDIYAAAGLGDLPKVQALVEAESELIYRRGPSGATALHFAATAAVAAYLLGQGADANTQDDRGRTPLTWNPGITEVVDTLLAHGAEIIDIFQACALGDVARVTQMLDADPSLLHQRKDPRTGTPLHVAADKGQIEVARLLIERGAVVNATTDSGNITPMHDAAFSGRVEMVKFLLTQGADAAARDTEFNATPLAWARFNGQGDVVAVLESKIP